MTSADYGYGSGADYQPVDDEVLESVIAGLRKGSQDEDLDRILQQIAMNQQAPAGQYIKIRGNGWFGKNKEDVERANIAKANEDLATMLARVVTNSGRLALHSHNVATKSLEFMYWQDAALPDSLKSSGKVLTKHLYSVVAKVSVEAQTMHGELSLHDIAKPYKDKA